jgi:hypothetical protein
MMIWRFGKNRRSYLNEISPALADDFYLHRLYKSRWKSVRRASHEVEIWTGDLITAKLKCIYYYNFIESLDTFLKRKRNVVDIVCQSSRNLSQCLLKHQAVETCRGAEAYEQFLFLIRYQMEMNDSAAIPSSCNCAGYWVGSAGLGAVEKEKFSLLYK